MVKKKKVSEKIDAKEWINHFLNVEFDIKKWLNDALNDYRRDAQNYYPILIEEDEREYEEKSPLFDIISKKFQKRGYLKGKEFFNICMWKTTRKKKNYEENSEEQIQKITKKAMNGKKNEKISILVNDLRGVGVAVASAILTVIYPQEFCVIDYRSKQALAWLKICGESKPYDEFKLNSYDKFLLILTFIRSSNDIELFYKYLDIIKGIGEKFNLTPRQIEIALWKFDKAMDLNYFF